MSAIKGTGLSQDPGQNVSGQCATLQERYGKIGISAVAAAIRHKGEQHKLHTPRRDGVVYDCD